MALFDAWYKAIIVLDASILLGLYRIAPEKRRQLLELLEALCDRIWIPRQFWEEYRRRRPEMRAFISREYKQTQAILQSSRDKSKKTLTHLNSRFSRGSELHILRIDTVYNEILADVLNSSKEHIRGIDFDDLDERIENLCAGRVGDPLPDSTIADIPSMWQWRLDRGIPPGLKDRKKREPNRYGDLMGWLQIKRHANGRDRPVIIVTDDVKAGDWFVLKNGSPSGPHPDLTGELYDEAGVELYLYTSEQFMRLANIYLKWQRHVAASGDYIHRLTPMLLPNFGKIAATGSLSALTAGVGIFNDYRHSLNVLPGLTAGVTNNGLLDSISEITALSDRYNHSFSTLAGFTAGESYNGFFDSISEITALSDRYNHSLNALPGLTAGVSSKGLLGSISAVTAFSDRYNHSFSTLAELTTNDSLKYIVDQLSSTAAVLKPYAELHRSTAHYMNSIREQQRIIADIVNPIREQQRMIADIVNPIREQQRMIADIVNPIREQQRMIADIVNPIREQQRMIADIVNPIREQQRMIAGIVNPIREQQRMIADIVNPMRE